MLYVLTCLETFRSDHGIIVRSMLTFLIICETFQSNHGIVGVIGFIHSTRIIVLILFILCVCVIDGMDIFLGN